MVILISHDSYVATSTLIVALINRHGLFRYHWSLIRDIMVVLIFTVFGGNLRRYLMIGGSHGFGVWGLLGYRLIQNEKLSLWGRNLASCRKFISYLTFSNKIHVWELFIGLVILELVDLVVILIKFLMNFLEVFESFESFLEVSCTILSTYRRCRVWSHCSHSLLSKHWIRFRFCHCLLLMVIGLSNESMLHARAILCHSKIQSFESTWAIVTVLCSHWFGRKDCKWLALVLLCWRSFNISIGSVSLSLKLSCVLIS